MIAPELLEEPVERVPGHRDLLAAGLDPRRVRGAVENPAEIKYKEGDGERFLLPAQSSDRLLVIAADGRVYTLAVDKLRQRPRPRRAALAGDRPRQGGRDPRPARPPPRRPARVRDPQGLRLRRRGEGDRGADPGRPAGRQPRPRATRLLAAVPAEGDHVARRRHQPQAADLSRGRAAGPGARQGGHADAAEGRGAGRPQDLRCGARPDLDRERQGAPPGRPHRPGAARAPAPAAWPRRASPRTIASAEPRRGDCVWCGSSSSSVVRS